MTGKRFRILHTEASIGWGGQEIRILTEAVKFMEEGHRVHLVCDPDSDIYTAAPRYGVERTAIAMKSRSPAALRNLRAFLREWRPEVINTHSSVDHWLSAVGRMRLGYRPAIVRTRHISVPVSRGKVTRWLYNSGSEFVMTTSQAIVTSLTGDGFLPPQRLSAVPTGIDTDVFVEGDRGATREELGLPHDAFIFVIVATLRSWKGHADLIDAFAQLRQENVRLVIVGDGPQEENIERRIVERSVQDRVTMTGRRTDVVPYLQAADAFVLPSYANEGVSQAMLQAMACRLPVVTCPIGGMPELGKNLTGVNFAEPRNPASLADTMSRLIRSPPDEKVRNALRDRVVQEYSRALMYRKALAAFETAVANVKSGRD